MRVESDADCARDDRDELVERQMLRTAEDERLADCVVARGEQLQATDEILHVDWMHAGRARAGNDHVTATHR